MAELFIEILSEEIPARFQEQAQDDCCKKFYELLVPFFPNLVAKNFQGFVTPRRLIVVIPSLPLQTEARTEEKRGPKESAPEAALQGFLKSAGLTKEQCSLENGYWFGTVTIPSRATQEILPEVLLTFFKTFSWPKTMRWPGSSLPWVRPVRSVLCMLDGKPLSFCIPELGPGLGLPTALTTQGHRFLSNHPIEVTSFADYQEKLRQAFVWIDSCERQDHIRQSLAALAKEKGLEIVADEALVKETAGLVEYPLCLLGGMDPVFTELPKEVVGTALRHHQKSFILTQPSSTKVAPFFGLVANCPPRGPEMLEGYERVLRARLSDARFFYEQDLKTPLRDWNAKLYAIVFHQRLGSLQDKVERLQTVMSTPEGQEAASLCKADLLTSLVGEFPELQGIMGRLYALTQGYSAPIADALQEYYGPQGPLDNCPTKPLSVELALTDKIDTLTGFFAIGEIPTGSKDPYALRRAALGVIRLIRENASRQDSFKELDIMQLVYQAQAAYQEQGIVNFSPSYQDTLRGFFLERLKVQLKQEGIRFDCVDAVSSLAQGPLNIWSLGERARTLQTFLDSEEGEALKAAFNRANGIVGAFTDAPPMPSKEGQWEEAEKRLQQHLEELERVSKDHLTQHRYGDLMRELATFRPVIDGFFELKVNDENAVLRERRHLLLKAFIYQTRPCADFSKIEGA